MLTINGETVEDAVIREETAALRPKYYEMMPEGDAVTLEMQLREWSRENVIERVLLRQEAARRAVVPEAMVAELQDGVPAVKPKEVTEFYARNKQKFWVPELLHCAQIVKNVDEVHGELEARAAMEAAQAELQRGTAFGVVADAHSDCPGHGGDLGWFPRGQMVPEFDEIVFSLTVGQTSGVFQTPFGFHIVKLLGRKPEGVPSLADVREHLAAQLLREKQQKAIEDFVDGLRASANVSW